MFMQTCVKLLNTVEFGEAEKFRFQCAEETFVSSITWDTHLTPRYLTYPGLYSVS